jgi:hypothetical protein
MVRILLMFIEDLLAGDTTAWVVLSIIGGVFGLFSLFWWKIARDMRREDEQTARRQRSRDRRKL